MPVLASISGVMNTLMAAGLMAWAAWVLTRALPAQNAAMILACLVLCEFALETIWHGGAWFGADLILWPAQIVLTRAAWRWMLRRRRRDWNYGLWLIALSAASVALAQFAWSGAARLAVLRFAATVVCLSLLSPWFISKFPQQPHNHAQ
ncbi:MAG TPA: hypothetical protein VGO59_10730 [Verrucomicrobiae bacterium]|jgi:hypothetical protein